MSIDKNNKGTSLIELVIAMTIVAIVLLMIMLFMNTATNCFKLTNDDVNLQMEAQTVINQLSDLVMEARDMEEPYTDLSGNVRFIFQYTEDDYYTIIKEDMELYQIHTSSLDNAREDNYIKEEHFLSEYVKELAIEKIENNGAVVIDLTLSVGKDEENIMKTIKFRNYQ